MCFLLRALPTFAHTDPRRSRTLHPLSAQCPPLKSACRRVQLAVGHYARLAPLQATLAAQPARVHPLTFVPPPLRPRAVGWYPEWGLVWEKYGVGRYAW